RPVPVGESTAAPRHRSGLSPRARPVGELRPHCHVRALRRIFVLRPHARARTVALGRCGHGRRGDLAQRSMTRRRPTGSRGYQSPTPPFARDPICSLIVYPTGGQVLPRERGAAVVEQAPTVRPKVRVDRQGSITDRILAYFLLPEMFFQRLSSL